MNLKNMKIVSVTARLLILAFLAGTLAFCTKPDNNTPEDTPGQEEPGGQDPQDPPGPEDPEDPVDPPLPSHFTSIEITSPTPSDPHFIEDQVGPAYGFSIDERFRFQAKGYPEGVDDEIEFIYTCPTPAFTVSPDGRATMLAGCGQPTSTNPFTYQNYRVFARSVKKPSVHSAVIYIRINGDPANRAVLRPMTGSSADYFYSTDYFHSPNKVNLRHTKYIGRGATQHFAILVERESSTGTHDYSGTGDYKIASQSGDVEFSTVTAGASTYLEAKAPYSAAINGTSKVTIQIGSYTREVEFIVSVLDPYTPKVGDFISCDGNGFYDGGNRGSGIVETITYDLTAKTEAMIAWTGSTHISEDMIYRDYCKGGIKCPDGAVVHGIAIPKRIDHLYRKSKTSGELYSEDMDNLTNSDAFPVWFSGDNVRRVVWKENYKMDAFALTCALVYHNRKCGSTHDVKPINFFVDNGTLQPTIDNGTTSDELNLCLDDFDWESDFYGSYDTGNLNSSGGAFSDRVVVTDQKTVVSPWLLPTISDFFYIFRGDRPDLVEIYKNNAMTGNTWSVSDKIAIFRKCLANVRPDADPLTWQYTFWTPQQSDYKHAPAFTIGSDSKAVISLKEKPTDRAYVLPVAYF